MDVRPVTLAAQNVRKRYGGVVALADGNLTVQGGEVLALLGANGSGKSTLGKILTGVAVPDGGAVLLDGAPVRFRSPQDARRAGVVAVFQELSLVADMTVAQNIALGQAPSLLGAWVDVRAQQRQAARLLALFDGLVRPSVSAATPVRALAPDERQIVEILKALGRQPRVLILDEATASLGAAQVERLFALVNDLKRDGVAVVFVSHRMDEIFAVADRAVVLRGGRTVGERALAASNRAELVALMIEGAEPPRADRAPIPPDAAVRLRAENVAAGALRGVHVAVRAGECVGLGGLRGQGQNELLLALFGALPHTGEVWLADVPLRARHPQDAMRAGVAYVPGDRGREGLLAARSIHENLQLPSWARWGVPLRVRAARGASAGIAASLQVKAAGIDAPVNTLSGGNAQKVVIGKWLLRQPRVLLLDDPTKGVDVGAKVEFYALLNALREQGTAILFYSSDDEELLALCDRVLVLHDGCVVAELSGGTLNRGALVAASLGGVPT